ncbi:hypothetical protein DPV78_000505 [Talaromyces pinophilus]|nr:hypothetical protein DPV78_000505 [Talaromyces pinophilus]
MSPYSRSGHQQLEASIACVAADCKYCFSEEYVSGKDMYFDEMNAEDLAESDLDDRDSNEKESDDDEGHAGNPPE